MIVLISYLMIPIAWVPYPQKECGYYRMIHAFVLIHISIFFGSKYTHISMCYSAILFFFFFYKQQAFIIRKKNYKEGSTRTIESREESSRQTEEKT